MFFVFPSAKSKGGRGEGGRDEITLLEYFPWVIFLLLSGVKRKHPVET